MLDEMGKLYIQELALAGAAARGEHNWEKGEGDHVGVKEGEDSNEIKIDSLLSVKRKRESER